MVLALVSGIFNIVLWVHACEVHAHEVHAHEGFCDEGHRIYT